MPTTSPENEKQEYRKTSSAMTKQLANESDNKNYNEITINEKKRWIMSSKRLQLVTGFLMFLLCLTGTIQGFAASSEKAITSFKIMGDGSVDELAKTVAVTVPFGTNVAALVPTVSVSPLAAVSPLSGVAQDFTAPLEYTVTAEDLSTQIYTVTVNASELAPVILGSTSNFVFLAGAAITSTGGGAINGDVGLSPAAGSFIGVTDAQVNGIIYAVDASGPAGSVVDATLLTTAKGDLTIAYNDAAGRTPIPSGPFLNPNGSNIGGLTLVPGLYKFTSTASITGSDVTLSGSENAVWIFQITSDLQVGNGIKVILAGGARSQNVFWQVGTSATIGTSAEFKGTVIADQSITMNSTSTLSGRLLAASAAITFDGSEATLPQDSSNATVTSATYTVSTLGGGSETITAVPFNTSKAAFLSNVTKGELNQSWNVSAIADPVVSGNSLAVTAQDGSTLITYNITVDAETDLAKVAADKAALVANDIRGLNPDLSNITVALTNPLPSAGSVNASAITWVSSSPAVVSNDGQTINRPAFASGDAIVTFTATLALNAATDTKPFTLTVLKSPASTIATVTSATYAVSTVGGGSETITAVPFNTSKAAFLSSLAKGETNQTWNDAAIADPVVSGNTLAVTAQDGTTQIAYAVTVDANPDIALVAADKAALVANDIRGINPDLSNVTAALTNPLPSAGSVNASAITWVSGSPAIVSNDGQTINRPAFASGDAIVTFTATLTKGLISDTKEFALTVIKAPASMQKAITSFEIFGNGIVDEGAKTVAVTVPFGTNVAALVPTISVSPLAAVNPISGVAHDFNSPAVYTVTAEDLSAQAYTVTVITASKHGAVNLGTAGSFVILSKSGISTTGTTAITGDLGVSPIDSTAITGFGLSMDPSGTFSTSSLVTGKLYAADYTDPTPSNLTTAVSDMELAYTDAATRPIPDYTELYAGDLTGQTLTPGLYKWGTDVLISAGGVTLAGSATDVWIFQIDQNLELASGAAVTLSGGAQVSNIFWQVAGQATLGTTSDMKGIILCQTAIVLDTGATLNGKALAQTAVTLDASNVYMKAQITSFNVTGGVTDMYGTNINVNVPYSTDVTVLAPTITVSPLATVSPVSGVTQDFTGPVTYTVTGSDLSTQEYTVTVIKSPASSIATVTSATYTVSTVGGGFETITAVPLNTSKATFLSRLTKGELYQTWNDTAITDPVVSGNTLTVTAQDGITAVTYTLTVTSPVITASSGANGSVAPSGATPVTYGGSQSYTITPDLGYHVNNVLIDLVPSGAVTSYDFNNVTADHTISASFAIDTFALASSAGANGSITPGETVNYGTNKTFTVTPDPGYHVADVLVDLVSAGPVTSYDFINVTAAHAISASFAIDNFTLTYTAGANGSISGASPQSVNYGASGTQVTAVPNATYHFRTWSDGVLTAARTDINVTGSIGVTATFSSDTGDLLVVDGSGSISGIPTNTNTPITANADVPPYTFAGWTVTSGSATIANASAASTTARLTGADGSSATVTANFSKLLVNGIPEIGVAGVTAGSKIFNITLPAGQTMLKVETSAGDIGDCDLYVKHGSVPTLSLYDEKSANEGNAELIEINDPASGEWYVMLDGYSDYSGVTLTITYTADAPEKVIALTASQNVYSDRIRLTWAGVIGATEYEIWRSEMNDLELANKINAVSAPTAAYDDVLTANTSYKYYYWVRAVNANYAGGFSDYAYGTIADSSVIDLVNGVAKTGLSGALGTMKTYRLAVPAGQTVFEVTASGGTGDCDINVSNSLNGSRRYSVRSTSSENIQYSIPDSGYYYVNIYGKTAYSGVTLLAKYTQGKPLPPTLSAASKGTFADRVVLTWTASSGATSYDVYRALKNTAVIPVFGNADYINSVSGTEYEDTGVIFGDNATPNVYYYWLQAANPAGASNQTVAVNGYLMPVPTAPGTVTASDGLYFDKVRVTWSKMANVTSYEVYRTEGTTFTGETLVGDSEASNLSTYTIDDSYVPVNTTLATKYYYWIKGINEVNAKTTLSKCDSGYLSKKGPVAVTATQSTLADGKIRLTWTSVNGATAYEVYRLNSGVYEYAGTSTAVSYEDTPGVTGLSVKYKILGKYDTAVPPVSYVSDYSPVASGVAAVAPVTLAAPVMKTVSTNLYEYVLITWCEVAKAQTYRLYRSEANVFKDAITVGGDLSSLTYKDMGIPAGEKYFYWVTAVNGAVESKPSASMAGTAAAPVTASFADPSTLPDGQTIAVDGSGMKGSIKYYSIDVPANTTRLVATLSGPATLADDCDVYAKLGAYPTIALYNMKGVENKAGEALTLSNPAAGTWYFMLYGAGTAGYTARTLKIACYSAADIYLTTVPCNDLNAPFTAVFKGKVVDKAGNGIAGLTLMARNPITGISSYLTAKTDYYGNFTYSDIVSTEGEHTFDFFFTTMPDPAKGTASHTVFTKNTSFNTSNFDFTAYLKATPVPLSTSAPDDLEGIQAFLNTSNGWDENLVSATYSAMWIEETVGSVQEDTALLGKLDQGLYMFFYGVEGAGAGNDTANVSGIPVSGLSAVPLVVHVDNADLATVLGNLQAMGIMDTSTATEIVAGKVGVVTVASLDSADAINDISLRSYEQVNVLSSITNNDLSVVFVADGKYSDVLTKKFTVTVGARVINVITSAFVTSTTTINEPK